jgi:hypothetical protein
MRQIKATLFEDKTKLNFFLKKQKIKLYSPDER